MLICSQELIEIIDSGVPPQTLLLITGRGGRLILSDRDIPASAESALGTPRADGTRRADGTWTPGAEPAVLGAGKKVVKWNKLKSSLTTSLGSLKSGLSQKEPDNIKVTLARDALPPGPSWLGAEAELRLV